MAGIGQRKQVQLIEYGQTTQATGNTTEGVVNTYDLWAEVNRDSGKTSFNRGLTQLEESMTFRVRFKFTYNPDSTYKIVYRGNKHSVKSIEPESEKQFYWIIKAETAHG